MNHVRVLGDPFGEGPVASRMRSFVRLAAASGLRCALSPGVVVSPLTAGVSPAGGESEPRVDMRLPPAEVELLLDAEFASVAASAPVVVFAAAADGRDAVRMAGLAWPLAAAVLHGSEETTAIALIERVRAELRWAGTAAAPHSVHEHELRPWIALPPPPGDGVVVHVGAGEHRDGTDLAVAVWREQVAGSGRILRLVLPDAPRAAVDGVEAALAGGGGTVEVVREPLRPEHLADAAAVLLPWRSVRWPRALVRALAAARPVCVSRWAGTASLVGRAGVCFPIGGRLAAIDGEACFEPARAAVAGALRRALGPEGRAVGARARRHVVEHLLRGRPAPAPALPTPLGDRRPRVVIEAPFFGRGRAAEASLATAAALCRRGHVALRLVPTQPFEHGLEALRARAPALEPLLERQPGRADLWLSAGLPSSGERPDCRSFALGVDWQYGALPVEWTPLVSTEADLVVVPSEHVADAVVAAGRPRATVHVVRPGVDAAKDCEATPDAEVVRWKGRLPAVLFESGCTWCAGFDLFLRTVLAARAAGRELAVVVRAAGDGTEDPGAEVRALLRRFARTPGAPPLLLVEREPSRQAAVRAACDVMLYPYRAEGVGLPVLAARAAGLPVLATAGAATDALMAGPGAFGIPAPRRDLVLPGEYVGSPWVREPVLAAAARLLVEVLDRLPEHRAAARAFGASVRETFTWDAAAAAIEGLARRAGSGRDLRPAKAASGGAAVATDGSRRPLVARQRNLSGIGQ